MYVQEEQHYQNNQYHQHDHVMNDNRTVEATFQTVTLDPMVVGAAMEEIAAANSQTQHANARAEAVVAQAHLHVANVEQQADQRVANVQAQAVQHASSVERIATTVV